MIAEFMKRLMSDAAPDPLTRDDARLALVGLLVRVARSDGDYAASEKRRIDRITMQRYGVTQEAAEAVRAQAEALESQAPDTVRFTRAIKDAVPYEERIGVIEALWQVVMADGHRENEEDALLRLVSNFLGVSDMDSALARQRVTQVP